jgi:hypothetical protein
VSTANVVNGAGASGQAISRGVNSGKVVLVADIRKENAEVAAQMLVDAGFNLEQRLSMCLRGRPTYHKLQSDL